MNAQTLALHARLLFQVGKFEQGRRLIREFSRALLDLHRTMESSALPPDTSCLAALGAQEAQTPLRWSIGELAAVLLVENSSGSRIQVLERSFCGGHPEGGRLPVEPGEHRRIFRSQIARADREVLLTARVTIELRGRRYHRWATALRIAPLGVDSSPISVAVLVEGD